MAFDLTDYLAKRDGAFEALPESMDAGFLTPKQQQVVQKTAEKTARLRADAQRQVDMFHANRESAVGKLELDNTTLGDAINVGVATINSGLGIFGTALSAPAEAYAQYQESQISPEDQAKAAVFGPEALEGDSLARMNAAIEARKTGQAIKDTLNIDEAVAYNRETGQRTSGLQRRVIGDGAVSLIDGSVKAVEAGLGLASLVSGGEAGKRANEAGFDTKKASELLQSWLSPEQQLADRKVEAADGFVDTLEAALDNPSVIPKNIAESLPSMVAGGAIGRGLGAVGVSAGVGGAVGEGAVMAGSQAEQIRQETDDQRLSLKQSLLAVGTGVMGAAVGVAGNKLAHLTKTADIDEAVVSGALGQSGRSGAAKVLAPAAIEGTEEVVQSAGEQVAQNLALDKDVFDGVGDAAAMGLITGSPMGAAGGLGQAARAKAERQTQEQVEVADFQAAVDAADPAPYLNPQTSNYAPDKAVAVLFAASQKDDVTPEAQAEHLSRAETIVSELEEQVQARQASLNDATPDGIAQMQTELAAAEQAGNQPLVSALQQGIADAEALTPAQRQADEAALTKLTDQLATAKQVTEQLTQLVSPKAADVTAQVEAAVSEPEAASKVITLAMHNPQALSEADLTGLIESQDNGLDDSQRQYLRQFNEARQARNALQSQADVHAEVLQGTEQNRGLVQYQGQMAQALRTGNDKKASQLMEQLKAFGQSHVQKFQVARQAYQVARDTNTPQQVINTAEGWQVAAEPLSAEQLRANGGLEIRAGKFSRPLIQNLQAEAKAIVATYKEFQAAQGQAKPASRRLPSGQTESQPAPAVQEVPVQAPMEAPNVAAEVAEVQDTPATEAPVDPQPARLSVFDGERAETVDASNYQSLNLVRQHFTQAKEAKGRALLETKDLIKNGQRALKEFAPVETLTVQQDKALSQFTQAARHWNGMLDRLLPPLDKVNPAFSYQKPIEFFMDPVTGELEDNVKTAISVGMYSWLNEHGRDLVGSPSHISRLLGWDKDKRLNRQVFEKVGHLGTRESVVANDIGQSVLQALGLTPLSTAGQNERARLEAGIGQFAIAFLLDQQLVERQMITKGELVALGAEQEANANWDEVERQQAEQDPTKVYFLRVRADQEDVKAIIEASTGSQNILDKVFGTNRRPSEPSRTVPEFTQRTTQNTDQPVPAGLAKILNELTQRPWRVVKDRVDILRSLPDELVNQLIGVVPVDEAKVHKDNRFGLQAKNEALLRDKQHAFDYIARLAEEDPALGQDLYMEYSVWKHHRVGMTGNVLNPQTSKVQRFLVGMTAWDSPIDPAKPAQADEFLLQVGAGLGIKVDKQGRDASLAQTRELLETSEMQDALAALAQALQGESLSPAEQQAIVTAVAIGGENLHSFAALVEQVKFDLAKAAGETFTSQLMGEVDGVTNGPMLSQILFGTITQDIAEKGGFYAEGASATDYPTWRGQAGHQDFYETLASRLTANLGSLFHVDQLQDIFAVTGDLTVKVDRNIVKRPLTAVNYGSSMGAAIEGMADEFIDRLYAQIEKLAAAPDRALASEQLSRLLGSISNLLVEQKQAKLNTSVSIEDAMNNTLSPAQERALKKAFADTVGVAMEAALTETLGDFLAARDTFNGYGRLAFDLYDAVYQHKRAQYVQDNLDGQIASNGAGQALHELNAEQELAVRRELAKMEPIMATAVSSRDGQLSAGVRLASSSKALDDAPAYAGQLSLGRTVPSAAGEKPVKTMRFRGFKRVVTGPGVASLVNGVQSTDSGIISQIYALMAVLNIHDAGGTGINLIAEMARGLNQSTFDNLLAYSPPAAMAETLSRVLTGVQQQVQADPALAGAIQQVLDRHKVDSTASFMQSVQRYVAQADSAKFAFLAQQQHISQYGLAGHSYTVTEANRQAADAARQAVTDSLPAPLEQALTALDEALARETAVDATVKPAEVSSWGEVGPSALASNPGLVQFFTEQPERTAGELFNVIEQGLSTDVQGQYLRKLLKLLGRTVNKDLQVTYITPETPFDGQDMTQLSNAMAWFHSERGIFIKSPAFAQSGVTPEVLMHELVHSVVAQETQYPSNGASQQLVDQLGDLLTWTKAYVKGNPALAEQYKDALSSVHELVAYGLTHKGFQDQVLRQVQVPHATEKNRFITAMQRFIDSITGLLFGNTSPTAVNGLTVLIEQASGLFAAAQQANQQDAPLVLAANATDPLAQLKLLTTQELFEQLSPAAQRFQPHLRSVQLNIADKLHGPFGMIKEALAAEQALTPNDRFLKALASGRLPFASAAQVNGVQMSAQEAFVFEQVEAITLASIDNTGATTVAYRELGKLYEEVKAKITPADIGQDAYDFIFTIQPTANGKSDYLARFAAAGLAYQPLADKLAFSTALDTRSLKGLSFWQALQAIFERILETLHSRLTHTQPGQLADSKLMTLLEQLVDIEAKRRTALAAPKGGFGEILEVQTRQLNDAVRRGIQTVVDSKLVRKNSISAVRALGAMASTVFGDRLDFFVDGMQRLRDQQFKQRPGLVMGLFNEIRGSHAGNLTAHQLLRETNNNERLRKHLITDTQQLVLGSFVNGGRDLTREQKAAITQGALRTDMQALIDEFPMDQLERLLSNKAELDQAINRYLGQLRGFQHYRYYQRAAKDLAYYMATGYNRSPNLAKNVVAIADLYGTRVLSPKVSESKAAQAVLDPLVSLLALRYTDGKTLASLAQVFRVENARGNDSGMQLTLRMHRQLQQDAKERLFEGSEGLMIKGYVPEVFNPHITVRAANAVDGKQLQRMGYARSDKALEQDAADPYAETMHLYRLEDGGLKAYVTGIFSTTGMHAKGSTVHSGEFDMQGQQLHAQNQRHSALIERRKASAVAALFNSADSYEPARVKGNHLAPVFNPRGRAVNYAYLMNHHTKDALLERNNSFDELLGKFAGSTFDKQATAEHNRIAVEALHEQYLAEYAQRPDSYIVVGPAAKEESLREAYKLLPKSTQQHIQDVWGSPNMLVRSDLIDMNFGYRKYSLTDMFSKQSKRDAEPGKAMRNALEEVFVDFWSFILADRSPGSAPYLSVDGRKAAEARAALKLRQAEDVWQEIVSEIKDILVVKSGLTLLGNVLSNISELVWIGVPLSDIVKHHRIALRGVVAYRKDAKELFQLQQLLATGTIQGSASDMRQRMVQLQDSIARSPVKQLIDAGLLPTIVEDVAQDVDEYSYKSKLVRGTERFTEGLNKHVKTAGKTLYMSHDTPLYQWLSQGTQVSDFLARYTAYQHMTGRQVAPLDHSAAVQFVSDAFVNYDIPTHRTMQYLNDMGIIWFTKYYLRIQKVIMNLWRDNPARALMLLGINHYFSGAQTLMDSGFVHHLGNPLSVGALKYPGSLDELATVNAMLSPFKGQ